MYEPLCEDVIVDVKVNFKFYNVGNTEVSGILIWN